MNDQQLHSIILDLIERIEELERCIGNGPCWLHETPAREMNKTEAMNRVEEIIDNRWLRLWPGRKVVD